MVVGDRLWLFSQPPHGAPTPIQSLLLNNIPPAPQHLSTVHPSILTRPYGTPTVSSMDPRQLMSPRSSQAFNLQQVQQNYMRKVSLPYNRPSPSSDVDFFYGQNKPPAIDENSRDHNTSGLADLERVFGSNSSILSDNNKLQEAINIEDDSGSSTNSDIDCEQVDVQESVKI
jgi:hypothetical protein